MTLLNLQVQDYWIWKAPLLSIGVEAYRQIASQTWPPLSFSFLYPDEKWDGHTTDSWHCEYSSVAETADIPYDADGGGDEGDGQEAEVHSHW